MLDYAHQYDGSDDTLTLGSFEPPTQQHHHNIGVGSDVLCFEVVSYRDWQSERRERLYS